jgi:hypothetical protein
LGLEHYHSGLADHRDTPVRSRRFAMGERRGLHCLRIAISQAWASWQTAIDKRETLR